MKPQYSVIIPTFNRREDLQRTLESYAVQSPDSPSFEIVVVDDGSTDGTASLLAEFRSERFRLVSDRQENRGPAAARNSALARASGEWVLFTGDDIAPHPRLLAEHAAGHERFADPTVAVLGVTLWPDDLVQTHTMRHITGRGAEQFSYHFMVDGDEYDYRHLYTSNVSLRRDLLDREPSYFSTEFPVAAFEDAELAYRLAGHGLKIRYHAAAQAFHYHSYTARSFFGRQVRCGRMAVVLTSKFPDTKPQLGLEPIDRYRRRVRLALHWRRRRFDRLVRELDTQVEAAISRAEALDRSISPKETEETVETRLRPLFRYGYLRGAIEKGCSAALVEPLSAELFRVIMSSAHR